MRDATVRPTEPEAAARLALAGLLETAGGVIECTVRGHSMDPTLPPGSTVRIRPRTGTPLSPGDVVAVAVRDRIITHRVVLGDSGGGHLLTRGDGCLLPDPPVAAEWILGRVVEARVNGSWGPVKTQPPRALLPTLARSISLGLLGILMSINLPLADRVAHAMVGAARAMGHHREDGVERIS